MDEKDIKKWEDALISLAEKGLIEFVELSDGSLGVCLNGRVKVMLK